MAEWVIKVSLLFSLCGRVRRPPDIAQITGGNPATTIRNLCKIVADYFQNNGFETIAARLPALDMMFFCNHGGGTWCIGCGHWRHLVHWLWALEALGALVVGTVGTWCIGCRHWRHLVHWLSALEALGALVVGTGGTRCIGCGHCRAYLLSTQITRVWSQCWTASVWEVGVIYWIWYQPGRDNPTSDALPLAPFR